VKKKIHPKYFKKCKVVCVCGNTFKLGSAKTELNIEICYKCHPFYTGQDKIVDTAGRVQRFKKLMEKKRGK